MTADEFIAWATEQPEGEHYELVAGEVVNMALERVAREKALLFAPPVPNAETVVALMEVRHGNLTAFKNVDVLMADLHAADEADRPIQAGP